LVHLASGIGNVVFATPLLLVLERSRFVVEPLLDADYPGVDALFQDWSTIRAVYTGRCARRVLESHSKVVAAVPPFYWRKYASRYAGFYRPPDSLFYLNEQAYYLEFARFLGCDVDDPPYYFLPAPPNATNTSDSIVLAPGSKPREMAAKRWPFFAELAGRFDDVVLVGLTNELPGPCALARRQTFIERDCRRARGCRGGRRKRLRLGAPCWRARHPHRSIVWSNTPPYARKVPSKRHRPSSWA
jgi:hypothetical protein